MQVASGAVKLVFPCWRGFMSTRKELSDKPLCRMRTRIRGKFHVVNFRWFG